MKKFLLFFVAALLIFSCAKESQDVEPTNPWSGYKKITKDLGEHDLIAGQHIVVGTVEYYILWNTTIEGVTSDYFVAEYTCDEGYLLTETHMWCDDINKDPDIDDDGTFELPINKPGSPRIGKFPYACDHGSGVSTYAYYVDLYDLPAYEQGFAVSTHAVVIGDNFNETAWGDGNEIYDKGWGMYDCFSFNNDHTPVYIVYSVEIDNDTLRVFWMDLTHGESEQIYKEPIDPTHVYDGAAFDEVAGKVYFTDVTTVEVYEIDLRSDAPTTTVGSISGTPVSGTFSNGSYYYVDASSLEIHEVQINPDGSMGTPNVVATIPYTGVIVNDLTLTADGNTIYILASENGVVKLISYVISSNTFSVLTVNGLDESAQITWVDTELVAIQETTDGWTKFTVNTSTGDVDDGTVIIDDPGPRGTNVSNIRII